MSKLEKEQEEEEEEDSVMDYYSDSGEVSDDNPHGFVRANDIKYYKMNKTEQKALKKELALTDMKEKK